MDILDNEINKRLIAGNFPSEILHVVDNYDVAAVDLATLAKAGMGILREYPILTFGLFTTFANRVKEIESLNREELFEQEVNILINTEYAVDSLNAGGKIYLEGSKLFPAVTTVDKILWYGSWIYYFSNDAMPTNEHFSQYRDMMFAWMYLLKIVQEKEIKYGLSINVKAITNKTNILKLIEADWTKVDKKYFSRLTDYGKKKLHDVRAEQVALSEKVKAENVEQKTFAEKTESEWSRFIDVINDLSQKEKEAISRINRAGSPKDKLRIINEYNSIISGIECAKYNLGTGEINLLDLFEVINERMQKASAYCVVKTSDNNIFRLHPAAFMLAMDPVTFNYLFLSFHQFRLNPGKDSAKKFTALALSSLKKNFGESVSKHISIDDIIEDFYLTVTGFMRKNEAAINRLSFDSLQKDSAVVAADISLDTDFMMKDISVRLKELGNSKEYDREIEKMLTGTGVALSADRIAELVRLEEEQSDLIEKETVASRIIISLNIIYMFCEVLRIIIVNRHANIKVKSRESIEKFRRDLLLIDDKLVHKVYGHLGDREMGMLEYREKTGIITTSLSEQEVEEENYRNSVFAEVLKNSINSLIDGIEGKSEEDILRIKAQIREEILRFPECDEKERYTGWLDEVSQRLSDALVSNCKKVDDYQKIKDGILCSLGEKATRLPESTVDSLTTAEMLYARYASEEFAEKGFDFSCISALYYQAFEEAYNILIWRGYSDELNALEFAGRKYTDILNDCKRRGIDVADARGYLDADPQQRGYYIDYQNRNRPETKVSSRCMYKSFAILLQNIVPNTRIEKLCDYFAKITGFGSRADMFNDDDFMRNCYAFTAAVDSSADNRNNASHGGTFISVDQCKSDKKAVLSELESVRSDSLGLIRQLLFILK